MNVKKAIKKVVAIGAGLTMIGATIMGASALTLSDYPQPFVKNGIFGGKIIIGQAASPADVIGAIDISASLQAASKTAVDVAGTTTTTVTGGVSISEANNAFTYGDNLASFNNNKYDDGDFPTLLVDGTVTDKKGTNKDDEADYEQYITFGTYGLAFDRSGFDSDYENPIVALDLAGVDSSSPLITFTVDMKGSDFVDAVYLDDSETIEMFGKSFTFDAGNTNSSELTLWGSEATAYVEMGTAKTISMDGTDYEIKVLGGNSGASPANAILSVNGDIETVEEGTSYTIGNLEVYIQDLMINDIGTQYVAINLFVGSDEWTLPAASSSPTPTNLKVNGDTVDSVYVSVTGAGNEDITQIDFLFDSSELDYVGIDSEYYDWLAMGDSITVPYLGFKLDFSGVAPAFDASSKTEVGLKRSGNGYDLSFTNEDDTEFTFEVLSDAGDDANITTPFVADGKGYGGVVTGTSENVSKDQTFILDGTGTNPVTYVYQVTGFTTENDADVVRLKNVGTGVTKNYEAAETIDGTAVTVATLDKTNQKITLSASSKNYVYTKNGLKITIADVTTKAETAIINFAEDTFGDNVDDTTATTFNVTVYWDVDENVKLTTLQTSVASVNDKDDKVEYGMTAYGTWVELEIDNNGDYMNVFYGDTEANYNFGFGPTDALSVDTTAGSDGQYYNVNPLAVGIAVLDVNAPALGSTPMIVVGGPCANTVAAELMGMPAPCNTGFEAGKAFIKWYDANSALLVAGYEATETQGASRVLADYADYELTGTEVEVVVPTLSSITVNKVA